jgi:hypothetical protein
LIALRMRVSMSATGSVNLIVCFSSATRSLRNCGEPAAASILLSLVVVSGHWPTTNDQRQKTNGDLPGRLGNAGNFSPQCQTAEAKPAKPELAEIGPRPSANLAAVVPTRGKLGFWLSFAARQLKLLLDLRVLDSFCCRCQLSSCNYSSILVHSENALTGNLRPGTAFPDASAASAPDRLTLPWSRW